MRGYLFAGCLAATVTLAAGDMRANGVRVAGGMPAATAQTSRTPQLTRDPEYRLLELGGRRVRWAIPRPGLPVTITYAFLTHAAEFPGARNCDAMLPPEAALDRSRIESAAFRREVRAAFSAWEAATNVVFKEAAPGTEAGILIGADAKARGRAFTNVALHEDGTRPADAIRQSLICLNPLQPWKIGFDGDLETYDIRFTLMHEIGHAIGLDHPSPEGQLMSFRYVETARGLQKGDVAGAVALYGHKGGVAPPLRSASTATPPPPLSGRALTFGLGERTPQD